MSATAPSRPEANEYAPYYERYVSLVPDADLVETLERQGAETLALLRGLTEEQGAHRYEPGKWSVKQLVGHVNDGERIFAYRALAIARGDTQPLPGFDENAFVAAGNADRRPMRELLAEFAAVRAATAALFRGFDEAALSRRGVANNREYSVRSIAYIIAGHERHHADAPA